MKVLLVYDEIAEAAIRPDGPEDLGAEYESPHALERMLEAVRSCGHDANSMAFTEDFARQVRHAVPDLVFNIVEGIRGPVRESLAPGWLDHIGIPYTGSDGLTLAVSLDKTLTKMILAAHGARTPAFRRIRHLSEIDVTHLEFPLFVKPNAEGSSMGIRRASMVETPDELKQQVDWVLRNYKEDCLIEEFLPGREFCVGLLGNEELRLLPIVEVRSPGSFYCYEDKHEHRKELFCPAEISAEIAEEMRTVALEAFRALRCRDLARVDFKLDKAGRPAFLEINPLPGLASHYSLFSVQARAAGFEYDELMGHIIELAAKRSCISDEAIIR